MEKKNTVNQNLETPKKKKIDDVVLYNKAKFLVKKYLDLKHDQESTAQTYEAIAAGTEFKGTNLWVLIFAIFVASLGLNMNSIPVIIGAMLISPLMGPIQGVGMGLAISDLTMVKRSFTNLAVATVFSMMTSCLYFLISPIDEARSELLARTTPTIYDVLIAFFGGMAGIIATGSKGKGNVIPGVAIATALMPPLCTSGYGLATGQMKFFIGAFYLYMINCVYIGFATWLGVRILKIPKANITTDPAKKKKILQAVSFIVLITALPSIYITYKILKDNILQTEVNTFVSKEFDFPSTQVIRKNLIKEKDGKDILEVTLVGENIPSDSISIISSKMHFYGLKNTTLKVTQGYNPNNTLNQQELTTTIVQDMLKHNQTIMDEQREQISKLESQLSSYKHLDSIGTIIAPEVKVLFPEINDIAVASTYFNEIDSLKLKPVTLALISASKSLGDSERIKLKEWLTARIRRNDIDIIFTTDYK